MSFLDRSALGFGLGGPQFSELELIARIDEAVDRDPALFVVGSLSFEVRLRGLEQLFGQAIDFRGFRCTVVAAALGLLAAAASAGV